MKSPISKLLVLTTLVAAACSSTFAQDDAVALFNRAQDVHEKGDLAAAIDLYSKAIEAYPEFPEAEYQRASAYLSLGKRVDAEKGFRRALELRPDWTLAQASLGSLLVANNKYAEAEPLLTKALEVETQNVPALIALAELRVRSHAGQPSLEEILRRLTDITSKANANASLWNARAAVEFALKRTADARASLSQALKLDPTNRNSLFQSAELALLEGDVQRARTAVSSLEEKGVASDEISFLKAEILAADGKGDEAIKLLDTLPKTDAVAELRKRIVASSSTSTAELEEQLTKDEKNPALLGRLCSLYRREDPAKALVYCKRANEIEPKNPDYAIGFAAALVQAKQYDAAVNLLRQILQIIPDNWTARANLGTALFQSGRYAEAKPEFEWLISKDPKTPAPYFFLALAHDHLGEFFDAMANYQAFLKIADPVQNKDDIDSVKFRLPALEKELKKNKKNDR